MFEINYKEVALKFKRSVENLNPKSAFATQFKLGINLINLLFNYIILINYSTRLIS